MAVLFRKNNDLVLTVSSKIFVFRAFGSAFYQYFKGFADIFLVAFQRQFLLQSDDFLQTAAFYLVGNVIFKAFGSHGAFAFRVLEHVSGTVAYFAHQRQRGLMVFFGLAAETGNDVGGNGAFRHDTLDGSDAFQIIFAGINTVHPLEHGIAASLHRKVNVFAAVGVFSDGFNQLVRDVFGVGSGKTNSYLWREQSHLLHQFGEIDHFSIFFRMVGIDILSQKGYFLISLIDKLLCFVNDGFGIATALATTGIGHHTVSAEIVAASHDGDESRNAVGVVTDRINVIVGFLGGEHYVEGSFAESGLLNQGG